MTGIAEAVDYMRNGGSARRAIWGIARYLVIMNVPTRPKSVPPDIKSDELTEVIIEIDLSRGPTRYDPSDTDVLANDWELIDDNPPSSVPDPG